MLIFPFKCDFVKFKDFETIQPELEILKQIWKVLSSTTTCLNVIEKLEIVKHLLSLANNICRLVLTALVSFATNEWTFSKLKLIKNYLRSTMSDYYRSLMILKLEKIF